MWEALTGRTMQRLVIYSTISYILATADIGIEDLRFWCMITLVVLLEIMADMHGMKMGIETMLMMSRGKLLRLKAFTDAVERGEERDVEELNKILKERDDSNEK